jgi:hypothetical protein
MAGALTRINYISDDGVTYNIPQDASNATAAGNVAATGTAQKPGRTKPRYVLAQHPTTGRERKIVIGDPTNARWVGGTATLTLPDFDALMAPTVYQIRGRIGEQRLG